MNETDMAEKPIEKGFLIPDSQVGLLTKKLNQLAKRAEKLGCGEIDHRWLYRVNIIKPEKERGGDEVLVTRSYRAVVVTGDEPRFSGWRFVATLESAGEAGNLIRTMPGYDKDVPHRYRTADATCCDHCGKRRVRNETFLVEHAERGEIKQIGRDCIKDFLGGHGSPEKWARYADYLANALEACVGAEADDGYGMGGGGGVYAVSVERFLSATAAAIRQSGWVSRGAARESFVPISSTADDVWGALFPPRGISDQERAALRAYIKATPEDETLADSALEWARSLGAVPEAAGTLNDYLWNLYVVARREIVTYHESGLAASIIAAYQKHLEQEIKRQMMPRAAQDPQWVGSVGKRESFTATCVDRRVWENAYGIVRLYRFFDEQGNTLVWRCSGTDPQLVPGHAYKLTGKVEKHDWYEDRKQTVLTRCKVEELSDESLNELGRAHQAQSRRAKIEAEARARAAKNEAWARDMLRAWKPEELVGLELKIPGKDCWAVIQANAVEGEKPFKAQLFDQRGYGRYTACDSSGEALMHLAREGYTDFAIYPATLEEFSKGPEWRNAKPVETEYDMAPAIGM